MSEENKRSNQDKELKNNIKELPSGERKPLNDDHLKMINKPVVVRADAYKTIILYASRYANKSILPENWKEIYGILIGYSDNELVYIERAEALTFGHATDVQLDERHYGFIEEIQEKLDKEGKGLYMIGWFHSHPGLGLFFSYIDLINQLGFQAKNDDFCGLVFDHTLLGKKKQEKVEGTEYMITKYDTGFEIYRITNVNMDVNDPNYESNYYKVDYIVDGLSKYFFANVLSELSALATEGKPLQSAYREAISKEPYTPDAYPKSDKDFLVEIPMSEEMIFDVDDFFYDDKEKKEKKKQLKENAERLIFEGNKAFEEKDAFTGIEKYRQGIEKHRKLDDIERTLDLLRELSEKCISNNHLVFAEEFANELNNLAKKEKNEYFIGESKYIIGYLLLKSGENQVLKDALNTIRDAAIKFEKVNDFAGAGMCFNKIGTIYHSRLNNLESACLFYREAIENYNKAILRSHPSRKSMWSKPEMLSQKILDLKDVIEELLPKLENEDIQKKVMNELNSIKFNF
ncbi:MAG: hypothetical protein ACFFA6_05550 [Promethearchaeota archaeon]